MFLPLRDHNPTRRVPIVTVSLIVVNVCVWIVELMQGPNLGQFFARWGAIPYELTHMVDLVGPVPGTALYHVEGPTPIFLTALSSMFLHGGWLHLIMNMLFLWIFGDNVEDALGRWRYLALYVLWGLLGLGLHVAVDPDSVTPVVGASGAISGVVGAYVVLYPRARVQSLLFLGFFIQIVEVPALVLITVWTALQVFGGLTAMRGFGDGTAYWAHLGGLAAGWFLVRFIARDHLASRHWRERWLR